MTRKVVDTLSDTLKVSDSFFLDHNVQCHYTYQIGGSMLSIELTTDIEQHLQVAVRKSYQGDLQVAIASFLRLHEKYGWKEQFLKDIEAIRAEVRKQGGISSRKVKQAITRYRTPKENQHV